MAPGWRCEHKGRARRRTAPGSGPGLHDLGGRNEGAERRYIRRCGLGRHPVGHLQHHLVALPPVAIALPGSASFASDAGPRHLAPAPECLKGLETWADLTQIWVVTRAGPLWQARRRL